LSSSGPLIGGAAHPSVDPGFGSVHIAVLGLMAMRMNVVEYAPNSIAGLDCLARFLATAIPHTTFDGFLC
jgi:hypothetical protein